MFMGRSVSLQGEKPLATRLAKNSKSHFPTKPLLCLFGSIVFAAAVLAAPLNLDVSGKWEGTRAPSGLTGTTPYKVQSLKFKLIQTGSSITGSYSCYAGKSANTDCPNPQGNITNGSLEGENIKLTVQTLPNGIVCRYIGKVTISQIDGTYRCYAGGSFSSVGVWRVKR